MSGGDSAIERSQSAQQWRRPLAALAVGCVVLISGCVAEPSARKTPAAVSPSRTPGGTVASPSPSNSPSPNAQPLIVVTPNPLAQPPDYDILSTAGSMEWSINTASFDGASALTAGTNLLITTDLVGQSDSPNTWVFGPTGAVIGTGNGSGVPNPSGTAWAGSGGPTCDSAGTCTEAIWESGIGITPHVVSTVPVTPAEQVSVVAWGTQGLLVSYDPTNVCGHVVGFSTGFLDKASGVVTHVLGSGWLVLGLQGDILTASNGAAVLRVVKLGAGGFSRTYEAPHGWTFAGASVSPNGGYVAGVLINQDVGCSGNETAHETMLVSTKTGASTTLPGFYCEGWVTSTEMAGSESDEPAGALSLANMDGNSLLIANDAYFVGVLS